MINLMAYTHPSQKFSDEHGELAKIQIDNSLELGWRPEEIFLATNFPFEYKGVKSIIVEDKDPTLFNPRNGKINAINDLFIKGLLTENELYWLHDLDAFQLAPIYQSDLGLEGLDLGLVNCGYSDKFGGGVFFFSSRAGDIFSWVVDFIYKNKSDEEFGFTVLVNNDELNIRNRYKQLNITYNLGIYNIPQNYSKADKPLRIAHFHPHRPRHLKLFKDLLPDRLIKIFNKHGIQ